MHFNVFWKKYDIMHVTENIQGSQEEVRVNNMHAIWHNLLTHFTNSFAVFESNVNGVIEERVNLEILTLPISVNTT